MSQVQLYSENSAKALLLTAEGLELRTSSGLNLAVPSSGPIDTNMNGLTLLPASCVLKQELNGVWSVELVHALDDRGTEIHENSIIKINTPQFPDQLYRIHQVDANDSYVTAIAYPIFLDSADEVFLFDNRPTELDGQDALNWIMNGTEYSGQSNIAKYSTAYYINKNLVEALCSDDENSFLSRWGGEVAYNNRTIIINDHIGEDRNVRVETGFNLTGIRETIDTSTIVTRYIPVAYNGIMLPEKYVDSALIGDYPKVYAKQIDCSHLKLKESADGEGFESLALLYEAMRAHCIGLMAQGMDRPVISYDISMVDLSHTDEYKDYADLTKVTLGDTVHCKHRRLGIDVDERVVSLTWDCIYDEITELKLASTGADFFSDVATKAGVISEVVNVDNRTLVAEKINGAINMMNAQLRAQKDIVQKQDVRAILFEDLDTSSPTYGAMALGTQGFQIANTKTASGDWDWRTLGTANGFYADNIIGKHLLGYLVEGSTLKFGDEPNIMELKSIANGVRAEGHGDYEVVNKDEGNHYMNRIYMTNRERNYIDIRNYSNSTAKNFLQMEASATKNDFFIDNRDFARDANANQVHMWSESKPNDPAYPDGGVNGIEIFNRAYNSSTVNSRILFDYNLTMYAKEWITLNAKKLVLKIDGINNMEVYVTSDGTLKVRNIT